MEIIGLATAHKPLSILLIMSDSPSSPAAAPSSPSDSPVSQEAPPSYVKLAMRNMVRKGAKSLFHFTLTVFGLVGLLVGLSYLTR